jgi:aminoglycoside 6'-N-acetyltransferase I
MAEIVVRRLGIADRAEWAALRLALWPHHTIEELGGELDDMLKGDFAGFGAFDGSAPVGFAEASERAYGDGCDTAPVAWLEGIFVIEGYRRRGIAKRLVSAVEDWARSRGLSELGSDAALDNLTSRLSHALWGFEETERSVLFRKTL